MKACTVSKNFVRDGTPLAEVPDEAQDISRNRFVLREEA